MRSPSASTSARPLVDPQYLHRSHMAPVSVALSRG